MMNYREPILSEPPQTWEELEEELEERAEYEERRADAAFESRMLGD